VIELGLRAALLFVVGTARSAQCESSKSKVHGAGEFETSYQGIEKFSSIRRSR
jgi:hypothetical protein